MNKLELVEIKVIVTLINEKQIWGTLYKLPGERLQDLLNDGRAFLPFYGLAYQQTATKASIERMTMLNKNAIISIEERN